MNNEKTKGMWKRTFSLLGKFTIPWYLYVIQVILGIISTKVALLYIPYYSKLQTGELSRESLVGYLGFAALNCLVNICVQIPTFYASALVARELQKKMINHSLRIPMKEYEKNASNIISWITNDTGYVDGLIQALAGFITGMATVFMSTSSIGSLDTSMMVMIPIIIALMVAFTLLEGWLLFLRQRREARAKSELTAYFSEHLSFLKQVKQLHAEESELALGKQAIRINYRAEMYQALLTLLDNFTSGSLTNVVTILIFVLGVPMVRAGKIDLTGLAAFQSYVLIAYSAIQTIPQTFTSLMYYNGALFYIGEMMAEKEEVVTRKSGMDRMDEDIVFSNVSFCYDEGKTVLKNASFSIPRGKVTALVGPNGSGKSTIFKLIERFYEPDEGKILFGEENVENIHLNEWRESIAYVLQEPQLFDGTIRDNITYGMNRPVSDEEVTAIAKMACVDEFVSDFEEGYAYRIGDNGSKLSGGQRQRIAIARAMMLDPAYLLLDEATCNMDVYSETKVTEALLSLMKGRTTVMITHDMRMLKNADHVIVLKDGRVEADGTSEMTMETSETLRNFIGV